MKKLLKNIAKTIVRGWKYIDGKKTTIGAVVMLAGQGAKVFGILPPDKADFVMSAGSYIAGGGLIFKGLKTNAAKKVTKKIMKY